MTKRLAVLAALIVPVLVLSGCGSSGSGDDHTGTSSQGLTEITVGVVPYSPDSIIWYAAQSGIFKKYGLSVKTASAASPIAISAALTSGEQQFGFITVPVLINADIKDAGLKCVSPVAGQASSQEPTVLVASKKSGITSLKGLEGKTIAQVQLGSLNRLSTQVILARAGVKNVKYIAIPFPQMAQALKRGRVDAATITVPFKQTALDNGARVLAQPNAKLYAGGTTVCFAATTKYLQSHAKVAQAFQAGMKEAILYTKDHKHEVLKTLVKHLDLTPEVASKQVFGTNFKPVINTRSIGKIQSQMKQFGWIKKTVDPQTMVWSPGE